MGLAVLQHRWPLFRERLESSPATFEPRTSLPTFAVNSLDFFQAVPSPELGYRFSSLSRQPCVCFKHFRNLNYHGHQLFRR